MEMTTMESIMNMVGKGIGATILPKGYLDDIGNKSIQTIPIQMPDLTTEISIVYRKNKHMRCKPGVYGTADFLGQKRNR